MERLLVQVIQVKEVSDLLEVNGLLLTGEWILINTYFNKRIIYSLGKIKADHE